MNLLTSGALVDNRQFLENLSALGFDKIFCLKNEQAQIDCDPAEIDVVICNGLFLYNDISLFSRLKFIQLTSAGLDRLPMEEVERRGIVARNARGVFSVPMAEYAVGVILHFYKNFSFFEDNQREARWEKRRDLRELAGQTVCIVGAGSVGVTTAQRLKGFDVRILGVDQYTEPRGAFDEIRPTTRLDETLAESDVVILTIPLTAETRGMFDAARFASVKDGALFINMARGALVDETALSAALKSKKLG
ncbi:MAG: hydroxyacid dehydrogenase, partial [Thermoguttaceae bacterium]|nr:hydroxyacid dehydrogenase [Thermoguttaceae bacterium]